MAPVIAGSINPPAGWRAGRTLTGPHRRCAMFTYYSQLIGVECIPRSLLSWVFKSILTKFIFNNYIE